MEYKSSAKRGVEGNNARPTEVRSSVNACDRGQQAYCDQSQQYSREGTHDMHEVGGWAFVSMSNMSVM